MGSILDDVERVKRIDKDGMCAILERLPECCEDAIKSADKLRIPRAVEVSEKSSIRYGKPRKIIVAGMGGSAIGGNLLKDWLRSSMPLPIEVCRGYNLPAYADEETLVFATSYSGNTEETLSCFLEAVEERCMVIAVSSDGILQEFSEKLGLPLVKLPSGYPPRSALPYLFFPLIVSLKKLRVLPRVEEEIDEAISVLGEIREEVKPDIPVSKNMAKKIALSVKGRIPLVSGFDFYEGVALRMKTQFNENSKTPAKTEIFPELNHNETVGWTGLKRLTKHFSVILIRDHKEPLETRTRIEVTKRLIFDQGAANVLEIWSRGKGRLARMLSTMYVGDFASVYLAILYGFNPTPVEIIDELKKQLREKVDKTNELRRKLEALKAG